MRITQDIVSGIVTIVLAIVTLMALSTIPRTSYQAIAPDLFPRLCAYGLILGGLVLIGRGILRGGASINLPPLRPFLAVLLGVIAFGAIAPRAGFAPAGLLTLVISGIGSPDLKFRQTILAAVGLIIFSVVLFHSVLKLPMPVLMLPGYRL
jgi:putative tricarboxylic transport membrane protein